MPKRARVHFVSLRSSLVNLPISIYGPLLDRNIRPQNLAVHLKVISPVEGARECIETYIGWTGLASASSLAQFNSTEKSVETVEIDPQYAHGLGLAQDDIVEIGLLYDLPFAKAVTAEPLTSDDWEIIELHASHVESTLLSQVRVARTGQEIDVWVMSRTRVRLRVELPVATDPSSKESASLLTTDTEVSISPKQRRSGNQSVGNTTLQEMEESHVSVTKTQESHTAPHKAQVLRALPRRLTHAALPNFTGTQLFGYVAPSTFDRLRILQTAKENRFLYLKATLKRILPPLDPVLSPAALPVLATPAPRILKPDGSGKADIPDTNDSGNDITTFILVGRTSGLPESHIVFPIMPEEVQDWDLLLVSLTGDDTTMDDPQNNAKEISSIDTSVPATPLVGIDDVLGKCVGFCLRQFALQASAEVVRGVPALLVTSSPGNGKTSIVRYVTKAMEEDTRTYTYPCYVDVSRYTEQPVQKIRSLFQYWLENASWHKPSILILDNLDKLLGVEAEHSDSFRARHLTEIFISLYSSFSKTGPFNFRGILLLATASSTASLHPSINKAHIFQEILNVKPPNNNARRDIIAKLVRDRLEAAHDLQLDLEFPLNYSALATQTEGYSVTDLEDLVSRAIHQVATRMVLEMSPPVLSVSDFIAAQADFIPQSLRDVKLQKSDIGWSDIGGLRETRKVLRETLEWPAKYGPIFAQSPLRLRSGLLLYGFPGCGKTLLASAVAKECGLNFIGVKGPEILNKYIGASEKSVRDLFERASAAKPCILFFDEFDSIAPKRGHDSTGVTDRVVNQMLTQMDGAEGSDGVYVLAATSRPDLIDSALLRPGRLDKALFCGMPDLKDRTEILAVVGRQVSLSASLDLGEIAAATNSFSGADLQALLYNAHLEVIHRSLVDESESKRSPGPFVKESHLEFTIIEDATEKITSRAEESALEKRLRHIEQATLDKSNNVKTKLAVKSEITFEHIKHVLKTARPSVTREEHDRLSKIYHTFLLDRSGGHPAPSDEHSIGSRVSLM